MSFETGSRKHERVVGIAIISRKLNIYEYQLLENNNNKTQILYESSFNMYLLIKFQMKVLAIQ